MGYGKQEALSQVRRAGVERGSIEIAREADWADECDTLSSWKGLWDSVGSGAGLCFGAWVQVVKKIANELMNTSHSCLFVASLSSVSLPYALSRLIFMSVLGERTVIFGL